MYIRERLLFVLAVSFDLYHGTVSRSSKQIIFVNVVSN